MRLYHYLETKWALDNIRRRRLKLSTIEDMNDPYEGFCVCSDHEGTQDALEISEREFVTRYVALCFSRTGTNILMWSHYGLPVDLGLEVAEYTLGGKYDGWSYEGEVRVHYRRDEKDEESGQYFRQFNEKLTLREVIAGNCAAECTRVTVAKPS